jgi:hypothetical protein
MEFIVLSLIVIGAAGWLIGALKGRSERDRSQQSKRLFRNTSWGGDGSFYDGRQGDHSHSHHHNQDHDGIHDPGGWDGGSHSGHDGGGDGH